MFGLNSFSRSWQLRLNAELNYSQHQGKPLDQCKHNILHYFVVYSWCDCLLCWIQCSIKNHKSNLIQLIIDSSLEKIPWTVSNLSALFFHCSYFVFLFCMLFILHIRPQTEFLSHLFWVIWLHKLTALRAVFDNFPNDLKSGKLPVKVERDSPW